MSKKCKNATVANTFMQIVSTGLYLVIADTKSMQLANAELEKNKMFYVIDKQNFLQRGDT